MWITLAGSRAHHKEQAGGEGKEDAS